jgi:hypothetical protein
VFKYQLERKTQDVVPTLAAATAKKEARRAIKRFIGVVGVDVPRGRRPPF